MKEPKEKWAKHVNSQISKYKCSSQQAFEKMFSLIRNKRNAIIVMMKYHSIPTRLAKIKKQGKTYC